MSTPNESTITSTLSSTVTPKRTIVESSEREPKRWMVALDDTIESEWAFWAAVGDMDKERDALFLITVTNKKLKHEDKSKTILLPFAEKAQNAKVRHIALILGISRDVGSQLQRASIDYKIDTLVIGHTKGVGWMARFRNPSVAKGCISTTDCKIYVVHSPPANWKPEESAEEEQPPKSTPEKTSKKEKRSEDESIKHDEIRETIAKHLILPGKEYLVEVLVDK